MSVESKGNERRFLLLLVPGLICAILGATISLGVIWELNWYGRFIDNPFNIASNYGLPDWLPYFLISGFVLLAVGFSMIVMAFRANNIYADR
jgi:ABC-type lipoprotein release transport system permease subunit